MNMFVFCLSFTYTSDMRTLALLLAIGGISVVNAASSGFDAIFTNTATSMNTVIQYLSTSGPVQYQTEIFIGATPTIEDKAAVAIRLANFEQDHLKANGLPINEKKQTIKDQDGKDVTFDYSVKYSIGPTSTNAVFLEITFNNFYSYIKYHGLTLSRFKDEKDLFFIKRTQKFNAYTRFFDINGQSKKTAIIISRFNQEFNVAANPNTEYGYVLAESQRRSKTNAVSMENGYSYYNYYFKISNDAADFVEIFDRRPNTPIWYGLTVAATIAAMSVFYIVIKQHRTKLKGV